MSGPNWGNGQTLVDNMRWPHQSVYLRQPLTRQPLVNKTSTVPITTCTEVRVPTVVPRFPGDERFMSVLNPPTRRPRLSQLRRSSNLKQLGELPPKRPPSEGPSYRYSPAPGLSWIMENSYRIDKPFAGWKRPLEPPPNTLQRNGTLLNMKEEAVWNPDESTKRINAALEKLNDLPEGPFQTEEPVDEEMTDDTASKSETERNRNLALAPGHLVENHKHLPRTSRVKKAVLHQRNHIPERTNGVSLLPRLSLPTIQSTPGQQFLLGQLGRNTLLPSPKKLANGRGGKLKPIENEDMENDRTRKTSLSEPPNHSCSKRECSCLRHKPRLPTEVRRNARRAKRRNSLVKPETPESSSEEEEEAEEPPPPPPPPPKIPTPPPVIVESPVPSEESDFIFIEESAEEEEEEPEPEEEEEPEEPHRSPSKLPPVTPNPLRGAMMRDIPEGFSFTDAMRTFRRLDTDNDGYVNYHQMKHELPGCFTTSEKRFVKEIFDITNRSTFFGCREFMLLTILCYKINLLSGPLREAFQLLADLDLHDTIFMFVKGYQSIDRRQRGDITSHELFCLLGDVMSKDWTEDENELYEQIVTDLDIQEDEQPIGKLDFLTYIPYFISLEPALQKQCVSMRAKTLLQTT